MKTNWLGYYRYEKLYRKYYRLPFKPFAIVLDAITATYNWIIRSGY